MSMHMVCKGISTRAVLHLCKMTSTACVSPDYLAACLHVLDCNALHFTWQDRTMEAQTHFGVQTCTCSAIVARPHCLVASSFFVEERM